MQPNLKMCAKCGVFKQPAEFKRLLTRAQTIARGYAGIHRVEIESSMCKDCQPKPKPLHKLSKKDLHNKVEAGDINQFLADSIIKERNDSVNQRRSAKTKTRWAEMQSKEWQKLVYLVSAEITIIRHQLKYAYTIKDIPRQNYAKTYIATLNKLRARLRFAALRPQGAPESKYWPEHLTPQELDQIREVWEKIDEKARARMKLPIAMFHKPTLPEESRPKLAFEYAQADGVTPDERLANGIRLKLHTPQPEPKPSTDNTEWWLED